MRHGFETDEGNIEISEKDELNITFLTKLYSINTQKHINLNRIQYIMAQ